MAVAELKQYLENVRRSAGPAAANFPITVTTELPRGPSAPVKVGGARPVEGRASMVVVGHPCSGRVSYVLCTVVCLTRQCTVNTLTCPSAVDCRRLGQSQQLLLPARS